MAYTSGQLETIITTLEGALGSGAASITFEGRSITYRNPESIIKGITYFRSLLNAATNITPVRQIRMSSSKGL